MSDELLLKLPEAARRLNVGQNLLEQWVNDGRLRSIKISTNIRRIHIRDLEAFAEALRQECEDTERTERANMRRLVNGRRERREA